MRKLALWGHLFPILWPRAEGVILRYRRKRGQEGRHYYPIIQFQLPDGRTITGRSQTGWWRCPWPEGTCVGLRYCPQQPRRIEVESLLGLWSVPVFALIVVLLLLAAICANVWLRQIGLAH